MLTSVNTNKLTRSRTRQACSRGCYLGHRSLQDHVPHRQWGCTKNRCYYHQNIWSACWTVGGEMQEKADPVSVARHHGTHLTWSATQKSLVVTSHSMTCSPQNEWATFHKYNMCLGITADLFAHLAWCHSKGQRHHWGTSLVPRRR